MENEQSPTEPIEDIWGTGEACAPLGSPQNDGQQAADVSIPLGNYSAPPGVDYDGMTSEEATQLIAKMQSEMLRDPKHPLNVTGDPLRKSMLEHRTKLYEVKNRGLTNPDGLDKVFSDALEHKTQKEVQQQETLRQQARMELGRLEKLDFNTDALPSNFLDNIQPYQVRGLMEQRLWAEKNYKDLNPLLEQDLMSLGGGGGIQNLFLQFKDADLNPDLRDKVAFDVIEHIITAGRLKAEQAAETLANIEANRHKKDPFNGYR